MSRVDKTKPATIRLIQGSGQKERQDHGPRDTRAALETLVESVRILSEEQAMHHVLAGVEKIPALEAEIKRRDAQEEVDKSARQRALEDYAIQRDSWKLEKEQLQEDVKRFENDLFKEKKEVESLKTTLEHHSKHISSLEESLAEGTLNEENNKKQIQGLIKAIETERHKNAALNDDLKKSTTQASRARAEAHEIQKAYEKAKKQADWHKRELEAAASLTVPIVDDAKVIDGMDALWHRAASVICSTFYRDINLSDSKVSHEKQVAGILAHGWPQTKTFWATYEQKSGVSGALPLPQSNSEAATQMRCIAILVYLARIFVCDLLQPTYLLPKGSGINDLLIRQAYDNPAKATAFRASLQALLPAAQEEEIEKRTDKACDTIAALTNGLLPDRDDMEYRSQLKSLAEEASQVWRAICCFTDTFEPRFDTRRHENWSDSKFVFEKKQYKICNLGLVAPDSQEEPVIAIFPRLYVIYEGSFDLETSGVFLMRSQTKAAQDELENVPSSPRIARGHTRQQRIRARPGSIEISNEQANTTSRSFLGPKSGHD